MLFKKNIFFLFLIIFLQLNVKASVNELIQQSKAAIALGKVTLYADSSFFKHSNTIFEEGEFFEIVGQSRKEQDDKDQNQQYRWYKIKTLKGQIGWIFGDGLAVIMPEKLIDYSLRPYHKKQYSFGSGFDKSTLWIGALEGHDKNGSKKLLNNLYGEYYIVVTNEKGQSAILNYAEYSATSKGALKNAIIQDITDDNTPEIILERSTKIKETDVEDRVLEVYGFAGGTISKIFDERLTLLYDEDVPSPAQFKLVEIAPSEIRVAYIDFVACSNYQQGFETDIRSKTQERCLEYVTYTYNWDEGKRQFLTLYSPTRMAVEGVVDSTQTLYDAPTIERKSTGSIAAKSHFAIVKSFEDFIIDNGKAVGVAPWLMIHYEGKNAYLPASKVLFPSSEHASILQLYYKSPPLYKGKQKTIGQFVTIKP